MHLVTGATGNVGGEVVRSLVAAGEPVRALVRGPAPDGLPAGVETVVGNLNQPETLTDALAGVAGVFLLPGYADMSGLLDVIGRAGAKRVVLLSGPSAGSGDMTNAVTAFMVTSENAVRDSGLPATILRPSGFMSNTFQWAAHLAAGDTVREPFASVGVAMIDPADIAAVATLALTTSEHEGRTYRITGPQTLLPVDRVRILAEVLGRPLRFKAQADDEARQEMAASMPPEYVAAFFNFFAEGALDDSIILPTVEELTGRPPRTFEQWARSHRHAFT
jgi:uncharacterized protein YbjT (DUF2867 family)